MCQRVCVLMQVWVHKRTHVHTCTDNCAPSHTHINTDAVVSTVVTLLFSPHRTDDVMETALRCMSTMLKCDVP